jgi:hypothetical protein
MVIGLEGKIHDEEQYALGAIAEGKAAEEDQDSSPLAHFARERKETKADVDENRYRDREAYGTERGDDAPPAQRRVGASERATPMLHNMKQGPMPERTVHRFSLGVASLNANDSVSISDTHAWDTRSPSDGHGTPRREWAKKKGSRQRLQQQREREKEKAYNKNKAASSSMVQVSLIDERVMLDK